MASHIILFYKDGKMKRRKFLIATPALIAAVQAHAANNNLQTGKKFNLKYAPHFGMFKNHAGEDLVDQLKFCAEEGFSAWEDNGMMSRNVDVQERLGSEMTRLKITMGVFVAYAEFNATSFVHKPKAVKDNLVKIMKKAVEVSKRVNASWCTVVPGMFDTGTEWEYQTANVIENLKYCAEVLEAHDLIMVLEPLNAWSDHPGLFLTKIPQAYQICRAVNSPSCKILDDLYHQQITEGNLIPNMEKAWDEIAYFQVGDNPGRKEPTTGEINYLNVFKYIHSKGFEGVVGMEHGNSIPGKEGERAVIDAYRYCDSFIS
jgi:hydroxypyruvate isomerase